MMAQVEQDRRLERKMGLFFHNKKNVNNNKRNSDSGNIDYERLRRDLVKEFLDQAVEFSGDLGALDALEADEASHDYLLRIAQREGIDIDKYRV